MAFSRKHDLAHKTPRSKAMTSTSRRKVKRKDDVSARISALLEWHAKQGGSVHPNASIVHTESMGLAVVARGPIASDATIVSLPAKACITTCSAQAWIEGLLEQEADEEIWGQKAAKKKGKPPQKLREKDWILLYLVLHKLALLDDGKAPAEASQKGSGDDAERPAKRQRQEGDKSTRQDLKHAEYVALLPAEIHTPSNYTRRELEFLKESPLYAHAARKRRETRSACVRASVWLTEKMDRLPQAWQQLLARYDVQNAHKLMRQVGLLTGEKLKEKDDVDRELDAMDKDQEAWPLLAVWRWADSVHSSRAFPPQVLGSGETGAPVLLPVYDLLNHSRKARVTWFFDTGSREGKAEDASEQEAKVLLQIHYDVAEGEQIFNTYGPKSNEELLASYGFVNEGLEDDTVTVKLLGDLATPATQESKQDGRDAAAGQHYLHYGQPRPEALVQQLVQFLESAVHPLDQKKKKVYPHEHVQGKARERLRDLMNLKEAHWMITCYLENKSTAYEKSQSKYDDAAKARKSSVRPDVYRCIGIYRASQLRIIEWASSTGDKPEYDLTFEIDKIILGPKAARERLKKYKDFEKSLGLGTDPIS